MSRCVVNVATGPYRIGQERLIASLGGQANVKCWLDTMPPGSPSHFDVPYAFKAHALRAAAESGYTSLIWADASIKPVASLAPLWEKIERDGYWISRNGWTNYEWTAQAAYSHLGITPEKNRKVPHVVATAFGLSLAHPKGKAIYAAYLRLAGTRAFCGPWKNGTVPLGVASRRTGPCGPPDVRGHRHDQTALSVIAWRSGCNLTDPPEWFAYEGGATDKTVLVADGGLFAGLMPPEFW